MLKANPNKLIEIFNTTDSKDEFIEKCIQEFLLECEDWADYWELMHKCKFDFISKCQY